MTRKLVYCIISNEDTFYNYEQSISMKKDPAYWGFSSSAKKLHKMFDKLNVGDVLLFSQNKKVDYAGIVTKLYQDPNKSKQLGWRQNPDKIYDLIVEVKKVQVGIENIRDYVAWKNGTPNGATIISVDCSKFWNTFGQTIDNAGIELEKQPEEINDDTDAVAYIIGYETDGLLGPVRIGESSNSDNRIDGHDSGTYHNLVVYHREISPTGNGRDLEQRVHKALSAHRRIKKHWRTGNDKRTEWFNVSADIAKQVMMAEAAKLRLIQECK